MLEKVYYLIVRIIGGRSVNFYVRVDHEVVSCPVLVSIGVDKNGYRKVLDIDIAFEESYLSYLNHFNKIKDRGLKHVDLTISDDHKGLIKAQEEVFTHTPQERCICHYMRNVLSCVPYREKAKLAEYLKQIFASPTREMATSITHMIAQHYEVSYPKVSLKAIINSIANAGDYSRVIAIKIIPPLGYDIDLKEVRKQ